METTYINDNYRHLTNNVGHTVEEYRCFGCQEWFNKEHIDWTDDEDSHPYCEDCLPDTDDVW
jgi:hypothetical protein